MWSGGREVAQIDEAYLLHSESEHTARTSKAVRSSAEQASSQIENGSAPSNEGRRLQRKALLSMINSWKTEGMPASLLRTSRVPYLPHLILDQREKLQ